MNNLSYKDVSIIIVNYNTKELTKRCIKSVLNFTKNISFEIIVVENDSTDNSFVFLTNEFRLNNEVVILKSVENIGFGRACNLAIDEAKGKYIYLLNPDAFIENNVLEYYIKFITQNPDIGSIGSFILDEFGNPQHAYGSFSFIKKDIYNRYKEVLLSNFIPLKIKNIIKKKRNKDMNIGVEKFPKDVDYITGANLFIPKKLLDEIGYFDPVFFMYSEEVDLQFRIFRAGYRRVLIDGPKVIHEQGASFQSKESNNRRIMMNVGKLKFVKKYHPKFLYISYKFLFLFSIILQIITDLITRKYSIKENITFYKMYKNEIFIRKCNL